MDWGRQFVMRYTKTQTDWAEASTCTSLTQWWFSQPDLREHTQELLVYFPSISRHASENRIVTLKAHGWANHALCNQRVVAIEEHRALPDCIREDLDPYIYLCMQQFVPETIVPRMYRSRVRHTHIYIYIYIDR